MSGRSSSTEAGKIFVGGIARDVDEGILTSYFSQFGDVVLANVMRDKFGISRGFGFVAFDPPEVSMEVLKRVHVIEGRTIEIKQAVKHDRIFARGGPGGPGLPVPGGGTMPLPDKDGNIYVPRQVYVGGLPFNILEAEVREYFEKFGPVVSANLKYDFGQNPPKFRGFGFINFVEDESVEKALENYSSHQLGGKWIEVKRSKYSHVVQGENSGVIMPQMAQGSGSGRGGAYEGGGRAPAYQDPYGGAVPATRDPYGGTVSAGPSTSASRDPYGGQASGGYVGRTTSSYRSNPYGGSSGPSSRPYGGSSVGPTSGTGSVSYEARPLPRAQGQGYSASQRDFDPYMSGQQRQQYPSKTGGWRSQQPLNPPM